MKEGKGKSRPLKVYPTDPLGLPLYDQACCFFKYYFGTVL